MGIEAVLCDSREPDFAKALTFGCSSVAVTLLDAGDVWLTTSDGALIIVERKTASDLLNTLRDDRLFPQLQAMRTLTPWCYLAICGSLLPAPGGKCIADGRETGWGWTSIQGALLKVQEIGVHILWVPSDYQYEEAIKTLANRDRSIARVKPARDIALLSEAEAILTALPGVGEQMASKLIEHCGTAATALWALTSQVDSHIPGLGTGTKRRVRKALGLEDNLTLVPLDETRDEKVGAA